MTRIGVVIDTTKVPTLFSDESIAKLNLLGDVSWTNSDQPLSDGDAIALLKDCEIGIGSWGTPRPNEAVMKGCPELKLWVHVAGSVKAFFGPHLDGREMTIASCAPAIGTGVAEMVIGEIIMGLRRVIPNARDNRAGGHAPAKNVVKMEDAVIGVVGASQVGRETIRILKPFRSRVLVYDPFLSEDDAKALGVQRRDDLTAMCSECDAITLHTPALPETKHMMGRAQFQAMPDEAVFVNAARGSCVDEDALIAELQKGRLFAFLDVSEPEPAADDSPFRALPNCYYTSHIAGGPGPGLGRQAVADVEAFLSGGEPKMAVRAEQLGRLA